MDTTLPVYGTQTAADGFVVVSTWLPGKYTATRHTYDFYTKLEDAVAYHRALGNGQIRDYAPNGVFPVRNGLPIGGPLDLATMEAVEPKLFRRPWDAAQSTPENRLLLEASIFNGRRVA